MNEDIKHMHKDLFNEQEFNQFNPNPTPDALTQLINNDTKQSIKNIKIN